VRAAFSQGFFILVQPRAAPSARRQGFRDSPMLPNLRLLITATLSTFLLTAAAGLFVSLRLGHEPLTMRGDARAAFDENPINRISLSWSRPEQDRAAVLRDLTLPANAPRPGTDEQAAPAIATSPDAPPERAVAEPAKPEPQVASRSEYAAEPQIAPAPPVEAPQIASRDTPKPEPQPASSAPAEMPESAIGDDQRTATPAPDVIAAIGEPSQSVPASLTAKPMNAPSDSRPQVRKATSEKRVVQRRATPRAASGQSRLLTSRSRATFNTAAPFLFFGPASSP
jgi:hypothetical protein